MRVFFDTSALVKKYIDEPGQEALDELIEDATGIIVSAVYIVEISSFIHRKLRERKIKEADVDLMRKKVFEDYINFEHIVFSFDVQHKAIELVEKYPLKSLDAIQLASALRAKADMFVVSDKQLFKHAKSELKNVRLV